MPREEPPQSAAFASTVADVARGATPSTPAMVFGRYAVVALLGEGGMGAVYLAQDTKLERRIALKVLRSGNVAAGAKERMTREAKLMAKLAHPNVVAVHDAGDVDGQAYIAMEYVEGQTLASWLVAAPRTNVEIIDAFQFCGHALEKAHELGVVHRDFKPDNVLVDRGGRILVTDFGIATASAGEDAPAPAPAPAPAGSPAPRPRSLTRTGTLIGTPAYMSPEQLRGLRVTAASDQFSFAVALYEALYKQPPFAGETFEELRTSVLSGTFLPLPRDARRRVPEPVHRALLRALARPPRQRFPSMTELLAELVPSVPSSRGRWLGAVAVIVLGVLAALVAFRARGGSGGPADLRSAAASSAAQAVIVEVAIARAPSTLSGKVSHQYAFTAAGKTRDGTVLDVTKQVHWSIEAEAPATATIENKPPAHGRATFHGGGIYRVVATLDGLSSDVAIEVQGQRFEYGIVSNAPDAPREASVDGAMARLLVSAAQRFVSPGEHHYFWMSATLRGEHEDKRTDVHVGYGVAADGRPPFPYYVIEGQTAHLLRDRQLTPGQWYVFSLVSVQKRPDGGHVWEASARPEGGGALVVLGRLELDANRAELASVFAEVAWSDDACRAGLALSASAPSFRTHDRWAPAAHAKTAAFFGHCAAAATAPSPPLFAIHMPAEGGCNGCALF